MTEDWIAQFLFSLRLMSFWLGLILSVVIIVGDYLFLAVIRRQVTAKMFSPLSCWLPLSIQLRN